MRILIIEDETDLARAVRKALEEDGFAVDVAHDGESGLYQAQTCDYDAILLDLMLPRRNGWTVLDQLRKTKDTPVLILTARDGVDDRVRGLDDGADDYLVKPFNLDELRARIRSLIRRSAGKASSILRAGDVEFDTASRTVRKAGKAVTLSPKEYSVAEFLMMHRGELVTRTKLFEHVYDESEDTLSNVMDVYISNLRRKLGKDFITTRRGEGYLIHV
ncbi:MAG: response regulator transcription factor [Planctomycetes bacterium]|nr:response regulator transcription factor [Planctomycetota bacterium]MBI3843522.1 response regulator transcription factor [Planctomycetota bacterium]